MTFDKAVQFVLSQEGDFSDDPQDAGGATRWGISHRSYPELDIANLTREQAIDIYKKDFWDHCHCAELPDGLDLLVFDAAVNQGQTKAVLMLQQALKVTADGVIGAITIRAAQNAPNIRAEYLARRMYQYALIPQVLRFGLGWFRRIAQASQVAFEERA